MDGLKLYKWKENFNKEVQNIRIEFDAFFKGKKLEDCYQLKLDDLSENLVLKIIDTNLPDEIKDRLTKIFNETKPEDSV